MQLVTSKRSDQSAGGSFTELGFTSESRPVLHGQRGAPDHQVEFTSASRHDETDTSSVWRLNAIPSPRKRWKDLCVRKEIRRVKCDEAKPSCERCTRTGRNCDGYPIPRRPPPAALLIVLHEGVQVEDQQAAVACHYFYEVCAPTLVNYGSASFWNRLVLQACQSEESIRHLVIAAAQLDMHLRQPSLLRSNDDSAPFRWHYGKALRLISRATSPDAATVLVACLLLMLYNELQQNHFPALQHLIAGRKIITAHYSLATSPTQNTAIEEISHIFSKLELQTSEFHKHLVPPHRRLPTYLTPIESSDTDDIQRHLCTRCCISAFTGLEESALSLHTLALECTGIRLSGPPPRTRFHTVPSLTSRLNNWYACYSAFEKALPTETTLKDFGDLNVLRIYHLCLEIISRCAPFDNQEMAYDGYATSIELVMVSCGILMTAEVRLRTAKLLPPLFFVATKYRGVDYRRRAVTALRRCGADGQLLAEIAVRIMRVEERGVRLPVVCSDIPEQDRVQLWRVELDEAGQFYTVYFRRCSAMSAPASPLADHDVEQLEGHLTFPSQGWVWSCPRVISRRIVRVPLNSLLSI
ncbi:uncharacterized protein A1O9_07603 [Exophiala aquamarina CBS 119918]|uniref:Zn(2)-C6 fungal-type domain-containing protein n=1 Tax=Exophiala aquamarina CBS 119918 TaxID=1182545 RepID=A0A072P9R0_9EURO|nr:uncharacterized protein A1O9_07603 [Exophiala aquamarina CBS 119918]KEF56023.1 hypothetical protein A1O9_07603 [Exophiala aquamarina CBS 119918]